MCTYASFRVCMHECMYVHTKALCEGLYMHVCKTKQYQYEYVCLYVWTYTDTRAGTYTLTTIHVYISSCQNMTVLTYLRTSHTIHMHMEPSFCHARFRNPMIFINSCGNNMYICSYACACIRTYACQNQSSRAQHSFPAQNLTNIFGS